MRIAFPCPNVMPATNRDLRTAFEQLQQDPVQPRIYAFDLFRSLSRTNLLRDPRFNVL